MSNAFPGYNDDEKSQPKFVWRAIYEDGSVLHQIKEENGEIIELCTEHIDRVGLRAYELVENDEVAASFTFLPGDRVAFRKRVQLKAGEGVQTRHYLVAITRDEFCTMCFINEKTKEARIERTHLSKPNTTSTLYYPTSEADTDKILIE